MEDKDNECKLIVYLEDDGQKKERWAILREDGYWMHIQLYDKQKSKVMDAPSFKIPKSRVLKIKEVRDGRPGTR